MQPYLRSMSYESLKSIVPHLQLSKRLELSFLSKLVHGINRRVSFSVSFLKFHQTYSNPDCTTGVLFVESVEYSFESIGACHVEIRCLGRKRVSSEKDVARRYFEYFLRTSKLPVRQLELIQCQKQFHNFHGRPIPRLKIQRHSCHTHWITQNFPVWHRMELVELIDCRIEQLEDANILRARHIKFSARLEKYADAMIDSQLMLRLSVVLFVTEAKVECRIKMNHTESFAFACHILMNEMIPIGSYVTGVFEKDLNADELHKQLLRSFSGFSPEITWCVDRLGWRVKVRRECVVLRQHRGYTLFVFRDYFNTDSSQDCISFTAIRKSTLERQVAFLVAVVWFSFTFLVLFLFTLGVWLALQ